LFHIIYPTYFSFLFPPPPNLNLIERLWKFYKQKFCYNKYYEAFEEFKQKSKIFSQNIRRYKSTFWNRGGISFYIYFVKIKSKYFLLSLALIALVIFFAADSFAQCSMCRKIATDGANSKAVGTSLNKGILYLLAMPYCLLAFFFRKQIVGFTRTLRIKK
jgi:membrane glycosyltransferase